MGCPALGVWVAFLKQPTLPGEAPLNIPNLKLALVATLDTYNLYIVKVWMGAQKTVKVI
jgi:hypothetical protein